MQVALQIHQECALSIFLLEHRVSVKDPSGRFRYILPSVSEIIPIGNGLVVVVGEANQNTVLVPLAEGFITLPYNRGTPFSVGEYFDYDGSLKSYLYWNGDSGKRNQRNHVGTDFRVERNGIEVVSPVPGRIIWLGKDPNGGYGIDIETKAGIVVGVFHLNPLEDLHEGSTVKRGQLLGYVEFPGYPHIHIDAKQYRPNGLYFLDTYRPVFNDNDRCIEYLFNSQGDVTPVPGQCSPGYWTKMNDPQYP